MPFYSSTRKTLPYRQGDLASRKASSPISIPLSSNYFDVLSEEEDAPPEGTPLLGSELEFPGMHEALALSLDPKGKAPMSLRKREAEATEKNLQIALHRSRKEAQRKSRGGNELPICQEREATGRPWSSIVEPTTPITGGSTTHSPPLPPLLDPFPALPT